MNGGGGTGGTGGTFNPVSPAESPSSKHGGEGGEFNNSAAFQLPSLAVIMLSLAAYFLQS